MDFDAINEALEKAVKEACPHENCLPDFDPEGALGLGSHEIRRRWPRFSGTCPDCGQLVIAYASAEHYVMGDW